MGRTSPTAPLADETFFWKERSLPAWTIEAPAPGRRTPALLGPGAPARQRSRGSYRGGPSSSPARPPR